MRAYYNRTVSLVQLLLPVLSLLWVLAVPDRLGISLVTQQVIAVILGLAIAGAFLTEPYQRLPRICSVLIAIVAACSWFWYAWNFEQWMVRLAFRTPDMWIPGILALASMLEALRKSVGVTITILVGLVALYGFFGDVLPGPLSAETFAATRTVLYLYADSSGIPGMVVQIIIELVVPFVIFGKLMEIAGGMKFFNDLAMGMMGHRRGGPAKVAVVASSSFGTLSGSTVANIMSTGIMTIPLMKRTGFKPAQASAIEAVASNGAQLMPPVMGATAFIMAEFLQVPYSTIVLSALFPALLYYLALFLKIDSIAKKDNIKGLPKDELPKLKETMVEGWVFVIPLVVLVYLLFVKGVNPGLSAIYASATILAAYVTKHHSRNDVINFFKQIKTAGAEIIPLILIGGAAGAVVGIMNSTGFAFQLSLLLTNVAEQYGLFSMLLLTAVVSIILGMGMPTAAVYIVLVSVVSPSMINMGVDPIGAHLFLFYFGLLSMLTPPIAIGSMVAASIGKANMWTTGFYGMKFALVAYLLPFLWVYNPAVIMQGSALEVFVSVSNCVAAAVLLKYSFSASPHKLIPGFVWSWGVIILAMCVGASSLIFGTDSLIALIPSLAVVSVILYQLLLKKIPDEDVKVLT